MSLEPGLRLGPYEVVGLLGTGEGYRARDTRLGQQVAIKDLLAKFSEDPERLRRFEQEARAYLRGTDANRGSYKYQQAQWLPDGSGILFTASEQDPRMERLCLRLLA